MRSGSHAFAALVAAALLLLVPHTLGAEITSPALGDALLGGQGITIAWSGVQNSPTVRLTLMRSAVVGDQNAYQGYVPAIVSNVFVLQVNVTNTGSYLWTVPASTVIANATILLEKQPFSSGFSNASNPVLTSLGVLLSSRFNVSSECCTCHPL